MDIYLILQNQLAMMEWMIETNLAPTAQGLLRGQLDRTRARLEEWPVRME